MNLLQTMPGRIVLMALVQTAVLGAVVGEHAITLATGREMIVKTEPVDPRDLFRGDYVVLRYGMSEVEVNGLAGDRSFAPGDTVYVTLASRGDDWTPVALHHRKPSADTVKPDERMLRAAVDYVYEGLERPTVEEGRPACPAPCTTLRITYGIESYFVPEGTGHALEAERNKERVGVVIAVRRDGRAAIKALQLDGKTIAREGLF